MQSPETSLAVTERAGGLEKSLHITASGTLKGSKAYSQNQLFMLKWSLPKLVNNPSLDQTEMGKV